MVNQKKTEKAITTFVSKEVYDKWQVFCKQMNKSGYQILRQAVEEAVKDIIIPVNNQ